MVVTGPGTYKYYKVQETEFAIDHSQLNNTDRRINGGEPWDSFTCHAWMIDTARLVVCTEGGDIIVCENSGEYYAYVEKDTRQKIKTIVPYNKGFVVGWSNGLFTAYENDKNEEAHTGISTYRKTKEI